MTLRSWSRLCLLGSITLSGCFELVDLAERLQDECVSDADCDDGLWCNGVETCEICPPGAWCFGVNICLGRDVPCCLGVPLNSPRSCLELNAVRCDETADQCVTGSECELDADCADELFCNGIELCIDGLCFNGGAACRGAPCHEAEKRCEAAR